MSSSSSLRRFGSSLLRPRRSKVPRVAALTCAAMPPFVLSPRTRAHAHARTHNVDFPHSPPTHQLAPMDGVPSACCTCACTPRPQPKLPRQLCAAASKRAQDVAVSQIGASMDSASQRYLKLTVNQAARQSARTGERLDAALTPRSAQAKAQRPSTAASAKRLSLGASLDAMAVSHKSSDPWATSSMNKSATAQEGLPGDRRTSDFNINLSLHSLSLNSTEVFTEVKIFTGQKRTTEAAPRGGTNDVQVTTLTSGPATQSMDRLPFVAVSAEPSIEADTADRSDGVLVMPVLPSSEVKRLTPLREGSPASTKSPKSATKSSPLSFESPEDVRAMHTSLAASCEERTAVSATSTPHTPLLTGPSGARQKEQAHGPMHEDSRALAVEAVPADGKEREVVESAANRLNAMAEDSATSERALATAEKHSIADASLSPMSSEMPMFVVQPIAADASEEEDASEPTLSKRSKSVPMLRQVGRMQTFAGLPTPSNGEAVLVPQAHDDGSGTADVPKEITASSITSDMLTKFAAQDPVKAKLLADAQRRIMEKRKNRETSIPTTVDQGIGPAMAAGADGRKLGLGFGIEALTEAGVKQSIEQKLAAAVQARRNQG